MAGGRSARGRGGVKRDTWSTQEDQRAGNLEQEKGSSCLAQPEHFPQEGTVYSCKLCLMQGISGWLVSLEWTVKRH